MSQKLLEAEDDFEWWVMDMDDALDRFLDSLPPEIQESLDFSPRSLNVLEAWLLATYPHLESLLTPEQTLMLDGAARYIGETLRQAAGGHWSINLDDPMYVYFGLPILKKIGTSSEILCPLTLVTAATDRRTGTYLYGVLQHLINSPS